MTASIKYTFTWNINMLLTINTTHRQEAKKTERLPNQRQTVNKTGPGSFNRRSQMDSDNSKRWWIVSNRQPLSRSILLMKSSKGSEWIKLQTNGSYRTTLRFCKLHLDMQMLRPKNSYNLFSSLYEKTDLGEHKVRQSTSTGTIYSSRLLISGCTLHFVHKHE